MKIDSQGNLVAGIGHSDFVKGWFRQMEPMVPKFRQSDERLKLDIDVYEDTVREGGSAGGRHLDFVDRMVARATKELAGTVSYEDIIR